MKKSIQKLIVLVIVGWLMVFTGCRKEVVPASDKSAFDKQINTMVLDVVESCQSKLAGISPTAVIAESSLNGKGYSRLDEVIVQRLESKLRQDRHVLELSRENWFELRENKPLSLKGHSPGTADLVNNLVVFLISVEPDKVFERINVTIQAKDANARPIPGVKAQTMFKHYKQSPATMLLNTTAIKNPAPQGLKENPFNSLEQLCYSMASELSTVLKHGVEAGQSQVPNEEIQVVLCSQNFKSTDPRFKDSLIQELSQALVSMDGMASAVSQEDFGAVFKQMEFYKNNPNLFQQENETFKPGSVLLMAQTNSYPSQGVKQVSLRAIWRVSPLTDKTGALVLENSAGTYISGFTSKAWFNGPLPRVNQPSSYQPKKPAQKSDKGFD